MLFFYLFLLLLHATVMSLYGRRIDQSSASEGSTMRASVHTNWLWYNLWATARKNEREHKRANRELGDAYRRLGGCVEWCTSGYWASSEGWSERDRLRGDGTWACWRVSVLAGTRKRVSDADKVLIKYAIMRTRFARFAPPDAVYIRTIKEHLLTLMLRNRNKLTLCSQKQQLNYKIHCTIIW